ncbi:hypothetical protein AV530_012997 [Patagioenas fasciata monilis]|uniref:Uncharacterized protein n=1 Tax=Patagioenas fasciata monilis TaxID=372326 RepID=A0A1V4JAA6_PATFA|nr:hypothetical protein AV530_012997 [Patagioenas fasciata monilis]
MGSVFPSEKRTDSHFSLTDDQHSISTDNPDGLPNASGGKDHVSFSDCPCAAMEMQRSSRTRKFSALYKLS